jgi:hypothetical protein
MTRDKGLAGGLIPQQEIVPGAFTLSDVERHNQSVVSGSGPIDITTPPDQWAYAATFPFRRPEGSGAAGKVLLVRVEVEVHGGRIGIGCVARDLRTYVDAEIDCTPEDGPTVLELPLGCPDSHECGWLVVRNTAEGNRRSHATVRSIRTFPTVASRIPDLVEAEARPIPSVGPPHATRGGSRCGTIRKFQVVLTHTSRDWDWTRCSREDLIRRYADPKRLLDLPPFEELPPPPMHLYSGGLSILELAVDGDGAHIVARRLIDSHFKIQHATLAGARLVLCFESFLAVLPAAGAPLENVDLRPGIPGTRRHLDRFEFRLRRCPVGGSPKPEGNPALAAAVRYLRGELRTDARDGGKHPLHSQRHPTVPSQLRLSGWEGGLLCVDPGPGRYRPRG